MRRTLTLPLIGILVVVACAGGNQATEAGQAGYEVVAGSEPTVLTVDVDAPANSLDEYLQLSSPSLPVPTAPAPTTQVATTPKVTTTPTTRAPRSFTMAFTGDLLLHQRVNSTAAANAAGDPTRDYDYTPQLAALRPLLADVDWAVCHMEVSLSADNTRLRPYPTFRAPGGIARDVKEIGYDACTTASNHVLDHGPDGVTETLGVLDDAGLEHTGAARNAAEAAMNIWNELDGVRVAHLSYTYGFNGFSVPTRTPWLSNLIDEEQILRRAALARRQRAEYVIVSLHWGEQYQHSPNRQQRELGPRLLASPDIDLIIGHHAHVVQPIDRIDGEWLVYGLGNLLSASSSQIRRDELLVQVEVTEQPDGSFATELRAVPLHLDRPALTVHLSNPDGRSPDLDPALAAQLDASWARVSAVLESGSGWTDLTLG